MLFRNICSYSILINVNYMISCHSCHCYRQMGLKAKENRQKNHQGNLINIKNKIFKNKDISINELEFRFYCITSFCLNNKITQHTHKQYFLQAFLIYFATDMCLPKDWSSMCKVFTLVIQIKISEGRGHKNAKSSWLNGKHIDFRSLFLVAKLLFNLKCLHFQC